MNSKNKKAKILIILLMILILVVGLIAICYFVFTNNDSTENLANKNQKSVNIIEGENTPKQKKDIPWELTLANADNKIPEDYKFELEDIDSSRQFDSRAIEYLREMMKDIRKARHNQCLGTISI